MIRQLHIIIGTNPVKQVEADTNLDAAQLGWPDTLSGKLLGFKKEDSLELLTSASNPKHVTVLLNGKRYKFNRLDSDGSFELTKDW